MALFAPQVLQSIAGSTLPTREATPVINPQPLTLIKWAFMESGSIRSVLIYSRLAWRVADLAALLNGEVA